jgi:hypothetical protein
MADLTVIIQLTRSYLSIIKLTPEAPDTQYILEILYIFKMQKWSGNKTIDMLAKAKRENYAVLAQVWYVSSNLPAYYILLLAHLICVATILPLLWV